MTRLSIFSCSLWFLLTCVSIAGPVNLAVFPSEDLNVSLPFGGDTSQALEAINPDPDEAVSWQVVYEGESRDFVERAVNLLETRPERLLEGLPERFSFMGGETGSAIGDGGKNMYNRGGNSISLNDTRIFYSNFLPTTIAVNDGSARYVTAKLDGLFVFAGELKGVQKFSISGGLGHDDESDVAVDEFSLEVGGQTWRAFVKRVTKTRIGSRSFRRPSILHIFLVPDVPGLTRTYSESARVDGHTIGGLPDATPFHYLLFARDEGADYELSVFERLATNYLEELLPGPRWCKPEPAAGVIAGGGSVPINLKIDAEVIPAGLHETRLAILCDGEDPDNLPESAWRKVTLEVSPETFGVGMDQPEIAGLDGFAADSTEFGLVPVGGEVLPDPITVESSVPWLTVQPLGNGRWRLQAETSEFSPALYLPELTVSDGVSTMTLQVPVLVESRRFTHLQADPVRPRLYGLSRVLGNPGFVIVYDTLTQEEIQVIPVGREPIDFDLTENAEEMIVLNSGDPSISRIGLESLSIIETVPLTDFVVSTSPYDGRIVDGPGSVVYYVDKAENSRLQVFDLGALTVRQTFSADLIPLEFPEEGYGFGDMVISPDRTKLYGWAWSGSDFGGQPQRSQMVRFDVDVSGMLSGFIYSDETVPAGDDDIHLSRDGGELVFTKSLIDREDLSRVGKSFPYSASAISPGGELTGFRDGLYHLDDDARFILPSLAPNDFTPDYSWFVGVGEKEEILWTDLGALVTPAELGFSFTPAEGGGVVLPGRLSWTPVPEVRRYAIYLGTDAAAVASATPGSPEFFSEVAGLEMPLPSDLNAEETYHWRVVPLGASEPPFDVVRSFSVLPLSLTRMSIESMTVSGATERNETLGFEVSATASWNVGADVPWLSSETTTGTGPGEVSLILNAEELEPGVYRGNVVLTVDGVEVLIPVELTVLLSYFEAVAPDLENPMVWTVMGNTNQPDFLVAYNTDAELLTSVVELDLDASYITVHPRDNRIYVAQRSPAVIHGYDPQTLAHVSTIDLNDQVNGTIHNSGLFVLTAGPTGRLVVELLEEDRSVIILVDTETGGIVEEFSLGDIPAGGGVSSPDGRFYYHGDANFSPSDVTRFDLEGDQITELQSARFPGNNDSGAREIFMSGDGNRIAWNGGILDADLNLLKEIPIYLNSVSRDGSFVLDSRDLYNTTNGLKIGQLPVSTSRQTYGNSGENLYLFDRGVTVVNLAEFTQFPDSDVVVEPGDGASVVGTEVDLSWEPVPTAFSYSIYFGNDRDAVAAAGPDDSSFLGTLEATQWSEPLPGLELGGEYFWRVDMNGFSQTKKGSLQQFTIASVEPVPGKVVVIAMIGDEIEEQTVGFRANELKSWTAVSNDLWIQLLTTEGDTSGELRFEIDESRVGGRARTYTGSVTVSSGSESFVVPVEVDILELNIKLFAADPNRSLIYGINEGEWNHLFAIEGTSGEILDVMRLGTNVTDVAMDPVTDRLLAVDWGRDFNVARVVDLENFVELEPLDLGPDLYRIEIDPGRRTLVTEGRQQTIDIQFFDLDTLERKASFSGGAGDGKLDPVNNVYYRAENSSNADLVKYDLSTDPPNLVKELFHGSSIDRFLLTKDGEFLLWRSTVYNQDLEVINVLPEEAKSLSPGGELAVGQTGVFWLDDGTLVSELPLLSEQSAFTSDGKYLLTYSQQDQILQSIPVETITELPGPFPHDGTILADNPAELSWSPVDGAESYTLTLISPSLGQLVFENLLTPNFALPVEPANGEFVKWTVQAQIPDQPSVDLPTYRFGKRYPRRQTMEGGRFESVAMGPHHILTAVGGQRYELRSFDPLTGEIELLESNPLSGGNQGSGDAEQARLDRARGTLAFPNFRTDSDFAGVVFSFDAAAYNRAHITELLPPTGITRNFGGDIAMSGGLQLVGTHITDENLARVIAYTTHPRFEQTQLIGPSDSVEGDDFGQTIALFGNVAAISTKGDTSSLSPRLPAIYIFERDPTTGQWSEEQKLGIPGAESREIVGALEMNERFLAVTGQRGEIVHVYERGLGGLWSAQASFRGDQQRGASSSFGSTLALAGNKLFVGDPNARIDPQEGGVYSFVFDGAVWQEGVPVLPADLTTRRESFGKTISTWDGWLVVGGGIANTGQFTDITGHLFEIDPAANHTPLLPPTPVTDALAGQPFGMAVQATDLDGQGGLIMEALQLPAWATFVDEGEGRALLSGVPDGAAGSIYDIQLRVIDPEGATCYEAFRLTLLAPSDVAEITAEPEDVILIEGQDLLLRAEADGEAPFQWQWFHEGQPIPGAIRPSLEIAESHPDDAGEYHVEVSNVVGQAVSRKATVSVTPPQREAGGWTTFGNGTRRSGYHPALLKRHTFVSAWTTGLQPTTSLSRAVISDGLVGLSGENNQGSIVFGIDLLTGEERWRREFSDTRRANPISAHEGVFYYQETDASNSKLWAMSMDDGSINWEGAWISQSYQYESPAVTDRGVWIGGGYGSGIYGFDLDGTSLFYEILPQENGFWTPTVSEDRLFTWVNGVMREHDPETGSLLWSIDGPSWQNYHAGIVRGDRAYVGTSGGIIAVDLTEQKILWTQEGQFVKSPSLSGDYLHVIDSHTVLTFDAESGEPGPTYTVPFEENIVSNQPLLLTDHLIVAAENTTYIFDRETTEMVQEIGRGGEISYADGYLLIVDDRGAVEAFFANQAPEFTSGLPTEVNSGAAALPWELAMGDYITDADPADILTWEVVSASRPQLFESLQIDANSGFLSVLYNHWQSGSSEVTISAADQVGNVTEATVIFTVPEHTLPTLDVAEDLVLNRRTGLYEQTVTITNGAARDIAGFDLLIANLPRGVTVYNASGTIEDDWEINNREPLVVGASIVLILEYYTPDRGVVLEPQISASIIAEPEIDPEVANLGQAIDRIDIVDGGVLIEFTSISGVLYEIQYSDDMEVWKSSPTRVRAGGNRTRWIDRGPPRTDMPPLENGARFYRMRQLEPVGSDR